MHYVRIDFLKLKRHLIRQKSNTLILHIKSTIVDILTLIQVPHHLYIDFICTDEQLV